MTFLLILFLARLASARESSGADESCEHAGNADDEADDGLSDCNDPACFITPSCQPGTGVKAYGGRLDRALSRLTVAALVTTIDERCRFL